MTPEPARSRAARWAYIALGSVALALGFLGIFIPVVMPTTPFLLLAAWAYARGSKRLHTWLVEHPRFGPFLARWWRERSVPRRAKVVGITLVWLGIGPSVVFVVDAWYLRALLLLIAVGVTAYLLRLPSWESLSTVKAGTPGPVPPPQGDEAA